MRYFTAVAESGLGAASHGVELVSRLRFPEAPSAPRRAFRLEERAAVSVASRVHAVEDGEWADCNHGREDKQNSEHSLPPSCRANARNRLLFHARSAAV